MAETTRPFGPARDEKRYLSERVDVTGQRRKVLDVQTELTLAKRALDSTSAGSPNYQAAIDRYKKAVNALDEAKTELNRIEASARSDYRKAYKREQKGKAAEEAKTIDQQIQIEQNVLKRLQDSGQSTAAQQAKIQDLIDKKNGTGKYAPPATVVQTEGGTTNTSANVNEQMANAPLMLSQFSAPERKRLAQALKDAGYNVPVTGVYNDLLKSAYVQAILDNNGRNTELKQNNDVNTYLVLKAREVKAIQGAGGDGGRGGDLPAGTVSISTASEAAGLIEKVFQAELTRPPTPEEVKREFDALVKQEKKFSSVTRPVKRVGPNGQEYIEYVGGIDRNQFLADRIRNTDEYKNRKTQERKLTRDDLAKTARANGLDLDKDFGDVANAWINRVESGEDVNIFKNLIRGTAKLGMPQNVQSLMDNGLDLDSIYSPYKRVMASNLEVTPDSINLNDPLLRTAIGPDREMSIYDFEKQIRQDNRWQYTNKAREEVADATLKVLRDFGLMG